MYHIPMSCRSNRGSLICEQLSGSNHSITTIFSPQWPCPKNPISITLCGEFGSNRKLLIHASKPTTQHNAKQHGDTLLWPTAVPTPYHCDTWLSAVPCLAVKQFIQSHLQPLKKTLLCAYECICACLCVCDCCYVRIDSDKKFLHKGTMQALTGSHGNWLEGDKKSSTVYRSSRNTTRTHINTQHTIADW